MKLSEVKSLLPTLDSLDFVVEDGTVVPSHFHVTEVGVVTKHFIDCGGTVRVEQTINFQLWSANDVHHRLKPKKLLNIIALSERHLGIQDAEIEVEYQTNTIGKYGLDFDGSRFILKNTMTACLAEDRCGIPQPKREITLSELPQISITECSSEGGCC